MRVFACALAAVAALQSQPTFRAGVELIRIDVSVLDKAGKPVTGLQPEDFVVTIDGLPRRVSFATFYGPTPDAPGAAPAASSAANVATNKNAAPGRVVVFVVDLESMTPGYEKVLLQTASTLVDRLGPRDAVGLVLIPGKGVEITRDRARVREALKGLRGSPPATFLTHVISMREARAFETRDKLVIDEVVERECLLDRRTSCPNELRIESGLLLGEARRRMRSLPMMLAELNTRLQPIQAPKTLVVLSAGLPFEQESTRVLRGAAETNRGERDVDARRAAPPAGNGRQQSTGGTRSAGGRSV